MSWMDAGDIRHERRKKEKEKGKGWIDGDQVATDARIAAKNHKKAMEEQRKAEELARWKANAKARREQEKWQKKQDEKARKKDARP